MPIMAKTQVEDIWKQMARQNRQKKKKAQKLKRMVPCSIILILNIKLFIEQCD